MNLDPRLHQGSQTRREWLEGLGFSRRERIGLFIADTVSHLIEASHDQHLQFNRSWITEGERRTVARQEEIQQWSDAVAEAESEEAAMYGFDLSDFDDRAAWDKTRPAVDAMNEETDYSRDAFEFGQIYQPQSQQPSIDA